MRRHGEGTKTQQLEKLEKIMKKGRKNLKIIYFGKVMGKYKMKRRRKIEKKEKKKRKLWMI